MKLRVVLLVLAAVVGLACLCGCAALPKLIENTAGGVSVGAVVDDEIAHCQALCRKPDFAILGWKDDGAPLCICAEPEEVTVQHPLEKPQNY